MNILNIAFHSPPRNYGFAYLGLIPIYAVVFFVLPNMFAHNYTFLECLYFSAVTITTLGYGDMIPANITGKIISASEAVIGISLIGLFLNALSTAKNEASIAEERANNLIIYKETQKSKLNGAYKLAVPLINRHKRITARVTSPLENMRTAYNPKFTLSDMRDLHAPTCLISLGKDEPAVNKYFNSLDELNASISELIKIVDLRVFPELEQHCHNFIAAVNKLDSSQVISSNQGLADGTGPMVETVTRTLNEHEGEPKHVGSPGNLINIYVTLYHQIIFTMLLLDLIAKEMQEIEPINGPASNA